VNEEVPEKRIINTKICMPRSPRKTQISRSLGSQRLYLKEEAQASNKTLTVLRPTEEWKKENT
jgi:hypothetical protein